MPGGQSPQDPPWPGTSVKGGVALFLLVIVLALIPGLMGPRLGDAIGGIEEWVRHRGWNPVRRDPASSSRTFSHA